MMGGRLPKLPNPKQDFIPFTGGLDQETPTLETAPGTLRQSQNFEIGINSGYQDIVGYERFDGRTAPSAAQYATLPGTVTGSIVVGDTITGVDSSATGIVLAVVSGYFVITKITGTFQAEVLNVSASPEGTATAAQSIDGASTTLLDSQYRNLAADSYRADILPPTGSGGVLGVFRHPTGTTRFCFRNATDGLSAKLWGESASGWVEVDLGEELSFTSGGVTEIAAGDTITGATSTETATVEVVILLSGTWAGGDAAGRFILSGQSGPFQAENLNVGASSNLATIAGDSDAITLEPSGSYETVLGNFGGQLSQYRVYGCDGVNRGFEFDGSIFVPINTGMVTDAPTHVYVHKKQLCFSFAASFQNSGPGTPYLWSVIVGASEIATDDDITEFKAQPGNVDGGALVIYNKNSIHVLYGNSAADWKLVTYREEIGAYARTVQDLGQQIFLHERGISKLYTTQAYGNFQHATLSRLIQTFINERRSTVTASCIVRNKNQYRIFFSDGYGLYITFAGNKILGIMPVLFPEPVSCMFSLENANGTEDIFFGSTDGYVYQMEKGTSFDGDDITAFLMLHFWHSKMPRLDKTYLDLVMEAEGAGYAEYNISYELDYGSSETEQSGLTAATLDFGAAYWDSFVWDSFTWDAVSEVPYHQKLDGTAENISIIINKNSDHFVPVRFSGALITFLPRTLKR